MSLGTYRGSDRLFCRRCVMFDCCSLGCLLVGAWKLSVGVVRKVCLLKSGDGCKCSVDV